VRPVDDEGNVDMKLVNLWFVFCFTWAPANPNPSPNPDP
jgi:hypothetical protein